MVHDSPRIPGRQFAHFANLGLLMLILAIALGALAQVVALFLFHSANQTHSALIFGLHRRSMWWVFFVWLPGFAGYNAYVQLRRFMQDIPDARKYLTYWISSTVGIAYMVILWLILSTPLIIKGSH